MRAGTGTVHSCQGHLAASQQYSPHPSALPAGAEQSTCLSAMLGILACTALEDTGLRQALCNEPELLSRLARLTARLHTPLAAAPDWEDAIWCENHDCLCLWAASWNDCPLTSEAQQAALLQLLVAAGSILKGEVSLLASLPVQPPAGADVEQADRLTSCWSYGIFVIGQCVIFQCSAASRELSRGLSPTRLRSLLLLLAGSAQHVMRFVSAAAPAGQLQRALVLRVSQRLTQRSKTGHRAAGLSAISSDWLVLLAAPSSSRRQPAQ